MEKGLEDTVVRIHRAVRRHLVDNVGNLAVAGAPTYDEVTQIWTVPISCATDRGVLPVGKVCLDAEARIVAAPSRDELNEVAERLYRLTPVLVYAEKEALEAAGFEVVSR